MNQPQERAPGTGGAGLQPGPPQLTIRRRAIGAMARAAVERQPGIVRVGRGGPALWAWLAGPAVTARLRDGRVHVRLFVVARGGEPLAQLVERARHTIAGTIERQLGLELAEVTILVDGIAG